jgi:hypothetical protein
MHVSVDKCCIIRNKLFKVEIVEEPSEIRDVPREVKWFGNSMYREEVSGPD